jgi:crotonobetainyl-CoA:carnitine CoA-transferase CaiB-like acyl-CoA transferase
MSTGTRLPLEGKTVLCPAANIPGPYTASRLADLGAKVIKIEVPSGDQLAAAAPEWYRVITAKMQILTLDLKSDTGQKEMHDLLAEADLIITAVRPSALPRMGLAGLPGRYPQLSHVEMVGYDDPEVPGHDLTYQASHGTLQPPVMPSIPVVDLLAAEHAATLSLALLMEAAATGKGNHRRIVFDHAARLAGDAVRYGLHGEGTWFNGIAPTYAIYATADGHIALAAVEPRFANRVFNSWGRTKDELATMFTQRTSKEWEKAAKDLDIPLVSVRTSAEVREAAGVSLVTQPDGTTVGATEADMVKSRS